MTDCPKVWGAGCMGVKIESVHPLASHHVKIRILYKIGRGDERTNATARKKTIVNHKKLFNYYRIFKFFFYYKILNMTIYDCAVFMVLTS